MIEFLVDGRAVITLSGEIDLATVGSIRQEVAAALDAVPAELVLRMRDVRFIDSTGLGALVAARNACVERGIPLVVAEPSVQVLRMLQLTGLDQVIATLPAGVGAPKEEA